MSARGDGPVSGPAGDRFACQLASNQEEKDFFGGKRGWEWGVLVYF